MRLLENHLKLESFLEKYIKFVFPRRVYPSEKIMQLLRVIYPKLDLEQIKFYEGIPWFTKYVAPFVTAQALPDTYSLRKLNIHVKKYDENDCLILADIVHEAYHMVQYERFWKGWGIGFLRPFIVYYNACYITRGYRNNHFEIPAYEQEYAFQRFCNAHHITLSNPHDRETLEHLVEQTEMKTEYIEYKYEGKFLHLVISFLFCVLVAIVKPLMEFLLLVNYGILKGVSYILRILHSVLGHSRKAL
jgi:hypothetical protein